MSCLGANSLEEFRARCPRTRRTLDQAEATLQAAGVLQAPFDWIGCTAEPQPKLQGHWGKAASTANREKLLQTYDEDRRLRLRENGGTGAGSWLLPRQPGDPRQPDAHFCGNLKRRLCVPVCPPGSRCQHRREDGSLCNEPLDPHGWHAVKCEVGASRNRRHNSCRDWHSAKHRELTGFAAPTEQAVPAWDRRHPRTGELQRAVLDLSTNDPANGRHVYVDWSITCVHSTYAPRRGARADRDGLAAAQMVEQKRERYPPHGGELVPLVFETGGRPSDEAASFVRSYGADLDDGDRSELLGGLWRQISRTLQRGNAEMLLSALGR